jgi:hypothetical protein
MGKKWKFGRLRGHSRCALCGATSSRGLVLLPKQAILDCFIKHHIIIARSARVCKSHLTNQHRLRDIITSGLDGEYYSSSTPSSKKMSSKYSTRLSHSAVKKGRKRKKTNPPPLISLSTPELTFTSAHIESLDIIASSLIKQTSSSKEIANELDEELAAWKEVAEALHCQLESLKEVCGGKFSIQGLKENDDQIIRILGVPSYEKFISFVDELPFQTLQGHGTLDKYDQVACALLHLRTGSTWLFLSFLFYNTSKRQYDVEKCSIKVLTYIEACMYEKYVHFPSYDSIISRASPSMLEDLPGCVAFIDGTYLYGENSYFGSLHRSMFCHYKNELQLSKFLVICDPSGFIMGVYGPHDAVSDDKLFMKLVTDAKKISTSESNEDVDVLGCVKANQLWNWICSLPPNASFTMDAGFPKSETVLPSTLKVFLPSKLRKGEDSYTPEQAKMSRKVTEWRGVIERCNRRLKQFKLLSMRFPNSSLINAELYFHVAAILVNRYGQALSEIAESEEKDFSKYFS